MGMTFCLHRSKIKISKFWNPSLFWTATLETTPAAELSKEFSKLERPPKVGRQKPISSFWFGIYPSRTKMLGLWGKNGGYPSLFPTKTRKKPPPIKFYRPLGCLSSIIHRGPSAPRLPNQQTTRFSTEENTLKWHREFKFANQSKWKLDDKSLALFRVEFYNGEVLEGQRKMWVVVSCK